VIWLLIDSVKRVFLRHHLPYPVEVAVFAADAADQKPGDLKKMPFYSWEILPQGGAQSCWKDLNQCFPLLTLNHPVCGKPPIFFDSDKKIKLWCRRNNIKLLQGSGFGEYHFHNKKGYKILRFLELVSISN